MLTSMETVVNSGKGTRMITYFRYQEFSAHILKISQLAVKLKVI